MKSLLFSLGLVFVLALSNYSYAQLYSIEYLLSVHDLVSMNNSPGRKEIGKDIIIEAADTEISNNETNTTISLEHISGSDYIEYSGVGFYPNTAIIHPSYQTLMESLADHMKQDQTFDLRIHGYCNGDVSRPIILAGIMTKFFNIDDNDQQKTATALELTELRAAYAKRYLMAQGIPAERIKISGEGAQKMIYPESSVYAHYNDRIEFKIISK